MIDPLGYIKTFPCAVCGRGPSDPHHVKSRGAGGSDDIDNLLSLCRTHHTEVHMIGRKTFFKKYMQEINTSRVKLNLSIFTEDMF